MGEQHRDDTTYRMTEQVARRVREQVFDLRVEVDVFEWRLEVCAVADEIGRDAAAEGGDYRRDLQAADEAMYKDEGDILSMSPFRRAHGALLIP
ncbi:hypothetical protein F183_A44600 [Bryobacterales bacterium F-183]|nr:hypothetical protein F183_A44600 [Bryobacterales bacterium F-183]